MSEATLEATKATTEQYLTFRLHDEVFAIEIAKVREVLEYRALTKVPRMPAYVRGVINLRGNVVPVIDLHMKFGSDSTETTVDTCIVIAEVELGGEKMQLGALADAVEEVFDMDASQIEPAPRMGTRLNTDFIRGMGKKDESFVIILDADRVFGDDAMELSRAADEDAA